MRFPNPFTRPFLGPTFHMNGEDDTGSGDDGSTDVDTDVDAPDDTEAAQAAAAAAAANNPPAGSAAPPPPAPPAATGSAVLAAQIQQLMATNQQLSAQLAARNAPPPEADEPLDPDVERALQKRLAKAMAPHAQQLQQLQDLHDQQEFTREIVDNGYEQALVDEAKQIFVAWRQNGIPATRKDALYFAAGRQDNAARRTKRATPVTPTPPPAPKPNVHAVTERSGAGGRGGAGAPKPTAVVDTPRTKKERAAWIAAQEAKLEKQGGF